MKPCIENNSPNKKKSASSVSGVPTRPEAVPDKGLNHSETGHGENSPASRVSLTVSQKLPQFQLHMAKGTHGSAGVYYQPPALKDGGYPSAVWLCAPLQVLAACRDNNAGEWGKLLQWHDADGMQHEWVMPYRLLAGDGRPVLEALMNGGLTIAHRYRARVIEYLTEQSSTSRLRCVPKTGWVADGVYVTASDVIGNSQNETYRLQLETMPESKGQKGDLQSWRENVASLCASNSRLLFAVSTAFAGVLLKPCEQAGGGFHFVGQSSIGKSLTMLMAASVIGEPCKTVTTWRATDNGLEGVAAQHNDNLLMLDELGQVDGNKAGNIAYMLANGSGKARACKDGTAKPPATWRLLFLSNGELDLAQHMQASDKRSMAGQEVRMITIPADTGTGYGIFDCLHNCLNSKALADKCNTAVQQHYGTALPEFIQYLCDNWQTSIDAAKNDMNAFSSAQPTNADGQVRRAADRFGLVAAAGELATLAGITGWKPGSATQAAKDCFQAWINHRGGMGSHEQAEIIRRLLTTLEKDAARFETVDAANNQEQCRVSNRLGFFDNGIYIFTVSGFTEIMNGIDTKQAAIVLKEAGIIKHDIGRQLPREALPGIGRQRVYRIHKDDLPDMNT